jgi:hypothetical protein
MIPKQEKYEKRKPTTTNNSKPKTASRSPIRSGGNNGEIPHTILVSTHSVEAEYVPLLGQDDDSKSYGGV